MEELEGQSIPLLSDRIKELKLEHKKRKSAREKAIDNLFGESIGGVKSAIDKFDQQVKAEGQNPVSF